MHRNTIDAAITKRDVRAAGAVLISVTDYTADTPIGDLVGTVLDAVNEDQSRASGADIAFKMGQKVINGGSIGFEPIGYLNVREKFDGREVWLAGTASAVVMIVRHTNATATSDRQLRSVRHGTNNRRTSHLRSNMAT